MKPFRSFSDKAKLITALWILLSIGFLATTLVSYMVSRESVRNAIVATELPLTSDNIYTEIQKDLVRPILISSMMSRDTFLRDWIIDGERDAKRITRYLKEITTHYGTVSSFLVSDSTRTYHSGNGPLKQVSDGETRDAWYFRVRRMQEPYEINVDPDLANRDALTIFINYRVFDYQQNFIGATGVGLTVDTVTRMFDDYQMRYGRTVYLVDGKGMITLSGRSGNGLKRTEGMSTIATNLSEIEGLRDQAEAILRAGEGNFEYVSNGRPHFLNVRYIPELKWYLFVDKCADGDLDDIQQTLYINLLLCGLITAIVLLIVYFTVDRYQGRLETMASTDQLTGLANRHSLDLLLGQAFRESTRQHSPTSAILLDIDHFKNLNDKFGHLAGDRVLVELAATLKESLRSSDIACRWGGEEFLIVLPRTGIEAATRVADNLRKRVEQQQFVFETVKISITLSAGVATYLSGESRESFFARIDALLYRAKREGRNRVCDEASILDASSV